MGVEGAGGRCRVFARMRPLSPDAGGAPGAQASADGRVVRVALDAPEAEAKDFVFDRVFPGRTSQEEVFCEIGMPVLEECLKGFNCAVLAYGQTGSGKTHALLRRGRGAESHEAGLLPRMVSELFRRVAQDASETGATHEISAAALQVYNEHVDDLLRAEQQGAEGLNLEVRRGGEVPGLTWVQCKRAETLRKVFNRARANLVYAETWMNRASSRSHAIFQIRIARRGGGPGPCTVARLSVVDLAGSERVKKSGVEGVHLKEATAINKSLLALGNVVSALVAKSAHVPFRDSKLTRILDGSIGGNCKTVLLVCASSAMEHVPETLSSLEFAARAMDIEVNARINAVVEFESCARVEEEAVEEEPTLEEQLAEALERAARAESRAEVAERSAVEWRERAANFEAAAGRARKEELAAERRRAAAAIARLSERRDSAVDALEARLLELGLQLERSAMAQADAAAALERAQASAARCEASMLQRVEAAEEAGRRAAAAEEQLRCARAAVEGAEAAARARDAAARQREAAAEEREAALAEAAGALERERAEVRVEFGLAVEAQRSRVEARLRAGQETLEERLAEARARAAAELSRRLQLVEGREEDARKIEEQGAKLEAQRAELCKLIQEVEALRRGRGGAPRPGAIALPTLLMSRPRAGPCAGKLPRRARSAVELRAASAPLPASSLGKQGRLSLAGVATLLPSERTMGSARSVGASSRASSASCPGLQEACVARGASAGAVPSERTSAAPPP